MVAHEGNLKDKRSSKVAASEGVDELNSRGFMRSSVFPSPAPWQGNQCHLNKVPHVGVWAVSEPHSIWEF
jgi:hypothetical protein